jgi:phage tail-like protein
MPTVQALPVTPYSNFRFQIFFGTNPDAVAGVSKISGLKRTIEPIKHRDGGDSSTQRLTPGLASFEPITIERGISHDPAFEEWANLVYSPEGPGGVSLANFRRDITIELYNLQGTKVRAWNAYRCWVSEFTAVPELDANANAIAFESIIVQNEGFERDEAVVEQREF